MSWIRFDHELVSAVVRQEAEADRQRRAYYHELAERVYDDASGDGKEDAFRALDLKLFRLWGCEAVLRRVCDEFPRLQNHASVLEIKLAESEQREGAFLLPGGEGRKKTVHLGIQPARFRDVDSLLLFLRRELLRARDMTDPQFGYPEVLSLGPGLLPEGLVRDRYRILWTIAIDAKLARRGVLEPAARDQRWNAFRACYPRWEAADALQRFLELWCCDEPTHAMLLSLALGEPPPGGMRQEATGKETARGTACPLCGFPTFDWADPSLLSDSGLQAAIRADFPEWSPGHGSCARCAESYQPKPAWNMTRTSVGGEGL